MIPLFVFSLLGWSKVSVALDVDSAFRYLKFRVAGSRAVGAAKKLFPVVHS